MVEKTKGRKTIGQKVSKKDFRSKGQRSKLRKWEENFDSNILKYYYKIIY